MSVRTAVRNRFGTVAAIALMTTAGTVLVSACGPNDTGNGPEPTAAPGTAAPGRTGGAGTGGTGGSGGAGSTGSTGGAKEVNGTSAANHLTISTGTQTVVMNGTTVDFGTVVRDLAWSPDGKHAAFINGDGDLVTANPDGSDKVVLAKNPGGVTWSHPSWQHAEPSPSVTNSPGFLEHFNNIVFSASKGNVLTLQTVPVKGGTAPQELTPASSEGGGPPIPQPPKTGNTWSNAGGKRGQVAYANTPGGEVYIYDDYIRPNTRDLGKGSQPAPSPDGEQVVFVRSVNGHDHLFSKDAENQGKEKDLTPSATTDYTEPAWSPDGKTIAVRTPDGISTLPADGSAAPTPVSTFKGLPAFRP
ncbi:hypothetical protein PUR71_37040 [Streptomyces sp. SP17BM10]|uniref:hypothetical protein n=1 Tax=Streptomyces sp. SP17BM10 TaxID=3002530 RepID=UPI002E7865D2|nr:hypothetical protein [Streptomyces sp. SP17BM10]MEE1788466.1 hypothetical protein [Streptomyces sp. SP17BM10]